MVVSDDENQKLFDHLAAHGAQVFFMRSRVEFGTLGLAA